MSPSMSAVVSTSPPSARFNLVVNVYLGELASTKSTVLRIRKRPLPIGDLISHCSCSSSLVASALSAAMSVMRT